MKEYIGRLWWVVYACMGLMGTQVAACADVPMDEEAEYDQDELNAVNEPDGVDPEHEKGSPYSEWLPKEGCRDGWKWRYNSGGYASGVRCKRQSPTGGCVRCKMIQPTGYLLFEKCPPGWVHGDKLPWHWRWYYRNECNNCFKKVDSCK